MNHNNGVPLLGKIVLVFGAIFVVTWTIYSFRRPTLSPEQARNVDVNARYEMWQHSPGQITFAKLEQACAPLHEDADDISNTFKILNQSRPTAQDLERAYATARRLLQKYQGNLTIVRANLQEPFAAPPQRDPEALMPYYANFRNAARLFFLEADLARREGNVADTVQISLDGMQFGAQVMQNSEFIGRLVGHAIQSIARRELWRTLPTLDAKQARKLASSLDAINRQVPPASATLQNEEKFAQYLVLRAQGDRRGGSNFNFDSIFFTSFVWSRQKQFDNFTRYMDALVQQADKPCQFDRDAPPSPPRDLVSRLLLPVYVDARLSFLAARTQNALLITQAALRAYEAEHGQFPVDVNALAPGYLPALPGDPFNNDKPLRLSTTAEGTVLYSLGPDGRDDQGLPIINERDADGKPLTAVTRKTQSNSKGDIVAGVNL